MTPMTLKLTTSAFKATADIPAQYTCDGADMSPALSWSAPPEGTQSLALILEDPDAPGRTWVHWVLYDLPPTERELPAGVPPEDKLPSGARQGRNDFRRTGYGGPCPPPGPGHRYYFKLFALDKKLELPPGSTREQVDRSMHGHILAHAELMGRYHRK
jgi:Raf kinase inhibitor-like YbhB/YbcL family protein